MSVALAFCPRRCAKDTDAFRRGERFGVVAPFPRENRQTILSKRRTSKGGIDSGGRSFSRGALYALISNPIYVGEIRHKGVCHPGQHQAILDRAVWDRTQQQLREHRVRSKIRGASVQRSPLTDDWSTRMAMDLTPSHARKGERKCRYCVSRNFPAQGSTPARIGWRLPARELKKRVAAAVREMLDDQASVLEAAQKTDIDSRQIDRVLHAARTWSPRLQSDAEQTAALGALVERVELKCDGMGVSIKLPIAGTEKSRAQLSDAVAIARSFPMQLKRRGVELRLIVAITIVQRRPSICRC